MKKYRIADFSSSGIGIGYRYHVQRKCLFVEWVSIDSFSKLEDAYALYNILVAGPFIIKESKT